MSQQSSEPLHRRLIEKTWKDPVEWELEIIGAPVGPDSDGGVSIAIGFPASEEAGFEIESVEVLNEVIAFLEGLRGTCFTREVTR